MTASTVLIAIAGELADTAKGNLPKIRDGETVRREWYKNGIYYRETVYKGDIYVSQFDFRKRKSRRNMVVECNGGD